MASLDDDLLALAGDSSDEESAPPQTKPGSASPPQSPTSDQAKSSHVEKSKEMARKGVAKSVKAAKPARRSRKQKRADSEDEGEM